MSDKDNSKRGPSRGFPEDSVTWWQAVEFANRLSQKSGLEECYELAVAEAGAPGDQHPDPQFLGLDCEGYRLPTEAEWERAALAGSNTLFSGGDDLEAYGWYESNSDRKVHRCAEKAPNAWGLYDMSGNLNEWVWDKPGIRPFWFAVDFFVSENPDALDEERVRKGGSYWDRDSQCRVHESRAEGPGHAGDTGFRVVRTGG